MRHRPDKHRLPEFTQSGILLVDKPREWTSHDVVGFVRARFNAARVGHCGTLDPNATGLLVVVLGRFTKLSQKFSGEDKTYEATILLGKETDSQDMDGQVIAERDPSQVTPEQFQKVAATFLGEQDQLPPMVSAVKKDGQRLYALARKGMEVEREPKKIVIHSLNVNKIYLPYADFVVTCSKGTYVRTICSDMGTKLACGAVLYALNRTKSGSFDLSDAVSIDTLKTWTQDDLSDYMSRMLHLKISRLQEFTNF